MIEISCKEVIDGIEWNSSYEGETSEILTQLGICVADTIRNITADINERGGSATLEDIYEEFMDIIEKEIEDV